MITLPADTDNTVIIIKDHEDGVEAVIMSDHDDHAHKHSTFIAEDEDYLKELIEKEDWRVTGFGTRGADTFLTVQRCDSMFEFHPLNKNGNGASIEARFIKHATHPAFTITPTSSTATNVDVRLAKNASEEGTQTGLLFSLTRLPDTHLLVVTDNEAQAHQAAEDWVNGMVKYDRTSEALFAVESVMVSMAKDRAFTH